MRILVFGHRLDIGGTQVNAIDLCSWLQARHGHEIVYFATPGPMLDLVRKRGIPFIPAPEAASHPSRERRQSYRETVEAFAPDLIHVWDWPQCLDALYGGSLVSRVPMAATCMSMVVPRTLPRSLPTTFGTPGLVDQARAMGFRAASLTMPPVDVHLNAPASIEHGAATAFRERCGVGADDILLVTVSRLVEWMKAEGIGRTIEAVRSLAPSGQRLCFAIVGEGAARAQLQTLASAVNRELGRNAVVLAGPMLDPRPAYAAADIVLGMGGSALRGMAFAKPTVVVGEQGFSAVFEPETAGFFHREGIYGVGASAPGHKDLALEISRLASDPGLRSALGVFSREFVIEHYGLEHVGRGLNSFLTAAARHPRLVRQTVYDRIATGAVLVAGKLRSGRALRAGAAGA